MTKTNKQKLMKKYSKKATAAKTTAMVMPKQLKRTSQSEDSARVARHVNMIVDPCNAELGPTAYRGSDGIISRFRNFTVVGPTAGKTGFAFVYYPAYNAIQLLGVNTSDTINFVPTTGGPGQAFLLASGAAQRAVAACSAVTYTGTELDKSGVLYSGVVPIAALGAIKRVDEIAALLQHQSRVHDEDLEVKWSPSSVEEQYWESGAGTPSDPGDRNAIVIIGLGFNPLTTSNNFTIVNTFIAEWRPEPGQGLSTPNPSSHDVPGGLERVRSALQKLGNWWSSAYKTASKAYNSNIGKAVRVAVAAAM